MGVRSVRTSNGVLAWLPNYGPGHPWTCLSIAIQVHQEGAVVAGASPSGSQFQEPSNYMWTNQPGWRTSTTGEPSWLTGRPMWMNQYLDPNQLDEPTCRTDTANRPGEPASKSNLGEPTRRRTNPGRSNVEGEPTLREPTAPLLVRLSVAIRPRIPSIDILISNKESS